jgi:Tol biopolymer transport system component/DNA-binding winged helix-turn-helix (wHTH) protein
MQPFRSPSTPVRFGPFEVDFAVGELRKRGRKVPLQDQPFKVLTLLLHRPGDLITREELQRALWPSETFGEFDEGLNKAVQKLRQALDDSPDDPRFIETLPRKGYRFVAAVESSVAEPDGPSSQFGPVQPAKRRRADLLAWLMLGVVSLALVVLAAIHFQPIHSTAQPLLRTVPLTSYPGQQRTPALSPDGKQVAFSWDGEKGDNFDIYLKLVDGGAPLRLTTNPAEEDSPTWSPDGARIAFLRHSGATADILVIPALGGPERKLGQVHEPYGGLAWSPDGKLLAVVDRAPNESASVYFVSIESGEKRRVTSPPREYSGDSIPRFSPDGNALAFVRDFSGIGSILYEMPLTSSGARSEPRRLTFEGRVFSHDWTADGRRIVFSSGQTSARSLWTIPASGGAPGRLAVAGENALDLSISRSGNRMVYARSEFDSNIWRIPGPNATGNKTAASRFIASTKVDQEPQFSPDGTKIVFESSRSGNPEIWVCDREGSNPVQVTSLNGPIPGSPRWSPDSRWIAFDSTQTGNLDIYVVAADGGLPRRLTNEPSNNVRPSWSRDGRWVYFGSNRSGEWQIWKVPTQGGAAVQFTKKNGGAEAFETSDGKFVYYAKLDAPGIWKVPAEGGEETKVLEQGGQGLWALTDQGICFFEVSNSAAETTTGPALKFYSFALSRMSLLRVFPKETTIDTGSTALAVSPDSRWLLYTQIDRVGSDLILVENFR